MCEVNLVFLQLISKNFSQSGVVLHPHGCVVSRIVVIFPSFIPPRKSAHIWPAAGQDVTQGGLRPILRPHSGVTGRAAELGDHDRLVRRDLHDAGINRVELVAEADVLVLVIRRSLRSVAADSDPIGVIGAGVIIFETVPRRLGRLRFCGAVLI